MFLKVTIEQSERGAGKAKHKRPNNTITSIATQKSSSNILWLAREDIAKKVFIHGYVIPRLPVAVRQFRLELRLELKRVPVVVETHPTHAKVSVPLVRMLNNSWILEICVIVIQVRVSLTRIRSY